MLKNSVKVTVVRIDGVKKQDNLSCHVVVRGRLYDVLAPLTPHNKENQVLLPSNTSVSFEINSLEKSNKPLLYISFNTSLLISPQVWLPLHPFPTEIQTITETVIGPRILIKINEDREDFTTLDSETDQKAPNCENFFKEELEKKKAEIEKLQKALEIAESGKKSNWKFEVNNKNLDIVEILLNKYLIKNKVEGLFQKYKGSLYKFSSGFVEISVKNNTLVCRNDMLWSDLEDFISENCSEDMLIPGGLENNSLQYSSPRRPIAEMSNSTDSFKRFARPTTSISLKPSRYRPLHKPPFRT